MKRTRTQAENKKEIVKKREFNLNDWMEHITDRSRNPEAPLLVGMRTSKDKTSLVFAINEDFLDDVKWKLTDRIRIFRNPNNLKELIFLRGNHGYTMHSYLKTHHKKIWQIKIKAFTDIELNLNKRFMPLDYKKEKDYIRFELP